MFSKMILIIDDDPIFREILTGFMATRGGTVIQAANGAEAKRQLSAIADRVSLIVSDINMPGTDGIEFLAILKDRNRSIPLIIISGAHESSAATAKLLSQSYGLNLLGFLPKPPDFTELAKLVDPILAA